MRVYRIVCLLHKSGENETEYVIERRKGIFFKKWKEIFNIEDGRYKRMSYPNYEQAEKHLLEIYTKDGIGSLVTKSGNIYYVEPYSMNGY
jgi:hypothetical protein